MTVTHNSAAELGQLLASVERHLPGRPGGRRRLRLERRERSRSPGVAASRSSDRPRAERRLRARVQRRRSREVREPGHVAAQPRRRAARRLAARARREPLAPGRARSACWRRWRSTPTGRARTPSTRVPASWADLLRALVPPAALSPGAPGRRSRRGGRAAPRRVGWAVGCALAGADRDAAPARAVRRADLHVRRGPRPRACAPPGRGRRDVVLAPGAGDAPSRALDPARRSAASRSNCSRGRAARWSRAGWDRARRARRRRPGADVRHRGSRSSARSAARPRASAGSSSAARRVRRGGVLGARGSAGVGTAPHAAAGGGHRRGARRRRARAGPAADPRAAVTHPRRPQHPCRPELETVSHRTVPGPAPADARCSSAQASTACSTTVPTRRADRRPATGAASTGATIARSDALWEAAEPAPPIGGVHHYDWSFDDRIAGSLAAHRLRWLPIIDYSAPWAQSVPGQDHSPPRRRPRLRGVRGRVRRALRTRRLVLARSLGAARASRSTRTRSGTSRTTRAFWVPRPGRRPHTPICTCRARDAITAVQPGARVIVGGLTHPVTFLPAMLAAEPDAARAHRRRRDPSVRPHPRAVLLRRSAPRADCSTRSGSRTSRCT